MFKLKTLFNLRKFILFSLCIIFAITSCQKKIKAQTRSTKFETIVLDSMLVDSIESYIKNPTTEDWTDSLRTNLSKEFRMHLYRNKSEGIDTFLILTRYRYSASYFEYYYKEYKLYFGFVADEHSFANPWEGAALSIFDDDAIHVRRRDSTIYAPPINQVFDDEALLNRLFRLFNCTRYVQWKDDEGGDVLENLDSKKDIQVLRYSNFTTKRHSLIVFSSGNTWIKYHKYEMKDGDTTICHYIDIGIFDIGS